MNISSERRDILRRLGIDPALDKDEIIRQLREKWLAGVQAEIEERKADVPVVVDTGDGPR